MSEEEKEEKEREGERKSIKGNPFCPPPLPYPFPFFLLSSTEFPRAVWLAAYRFVDAAHTSMVSILHPPRIIAAAALAWALNYACHPSSFPEMHGMTGTGVRKDDVTPPYDPILTGLAKSPRPTVHESYLSWPKTLGVPSRIYGGMTSIDDEIFGQEEGEGDKEQGKSLFLPLLPPSPSSFFISMGDMYDSPSS